MNYSFTIVHTRAVRRAAPRRPVVALGDGAPYSAREGLQ